MSNNSINKKRSIQFKNSQLLSIVKCFVNGIRMLLKIKKIEFVTRVIFWVDKPL